MVTLTKLFSVLASLAIGLFFAKPILAQQEDRYFTLASGGVKGIYFPIASQICQDINTHALAHGERCGVMATSGTNDNLKGIASGEFDFAIVQSNALIEKLGTRENKQMITVAALHPEPVHIAVRALSDINQIDDLSGRIINVGDTGSGSREIALVLMRMADITMDESMLRGHGPSTQARELCDGRVEALIWVSGIGNASMVEAHRRCQIRLLEIPESIRTRMLEAVPGLVEISIPPDTYGDQKTAVKSLGPIARIVANKNLEVARIELVADAVLGPRADIRRVHRALSDLSAQDMRALFPQELGHPSYNLSK